MLEHEKLINPRSKVDGSTPELRETEHFYLDLSKQDPDVVEFLRLLSDYMRESVMGESLRKIEAEGYDATRYLADMHAKIAYPFIGLIVAVLGISFSLRSERSGGVIRSIGAGVAIGFSYWIIHAFALSLGRSGVIPPLLAAWLANIILGATSIAMFSRIRT